MTEGFKSNPSVTYLRKFTGFDESTILHWENGYSRPSIHSVDKLSLLCGIGIHSNPDEVYNPYARKVDYLPDKLPCRIGSHIHAARARKKLSCRQAAKHFQIDHNNFMAWEKNKVTPKPRYFPEIMKFIGYCPIPPLSNRSKYYLRRIYLRGRTKAQQAKKEGKCERSISKREITTLISLHHDRIHAFFAETSS